MADLKISQLPSATTPLAGTEVLPIVQSSATKQVSIVNLTEGRSISVADATLTTGNLVIGTSGKGINFSATSEAEGMTSQLLSWYEEGTWAPIIRGSGTAGIYELSTALGNYTRVGNKVTITCAITLAGSITGGGAGLLQIAGVPFSKIANSAAVGSVELSGVVFTGSTFISFGTRGASSTLYLGANVSGAGANYVSISDISASDTIDFTLTYQV